VLYYPNWIYYFDNKAIEVRHASVANATLIIVISTERMSELSIIGNHHVLHVDKDDKVYVLRWKNTYKPYEVNIKGVNFTFSRRFAELNPYGFAIINRYYSSNNNIIGDPSDDVEILKENIFKYLTSVFGPEKKKSKEDADVNTTVKALAIRDCFKLGPNTNINVYVFAIYAYLSQGLNWVIACDEKNVVGVTKLPDGGFAVKKFDGADTFKELLNNDHKLVFIKDEKNVFIVV